MSVVLTAIQYRKGRSLKHRRYDDIGRRTLGRSCEREVCVKQHASYRRRTFYVTVVTTTVATGFGHMPTYLNTVSS